MTEDFIDHPGVRDLLARIGGCIARGHALTLAELDGRPNRPHPTRTWAGMMHDHVTEEVKAEFADDPTMNFFVHRQLKMLATPYVLLSFKKGNTGLTRVARNKTRRSQQWGTRPLSSTFTPTDEAIVGWEVGPNFQDLRQMGLIEFEGKLCIDRITIPFVDDQEELPADSGSIFIPPFRPNLDMIERERIERLGLSEEDDETGTDS